MNAPAQLAKHIRDVHFGGNWTSVNLKDTLNGVTWQQATTRVHTFNTILTLVFHMHYYVEAICKVLQGGPLDAKDKYSFDHPPVSSTEDWTNLLELVWNDAEKFAKLVEQLPASKLWEDFSGNKYGNYYRNILGFLEHTHYHLGQITLIKKIVQQTNLSGEQAK